MTLTHRGAVPGVEACLRPSGSKGFCTARSGSALPRPDGFEEGVAEGPVFFCGSMQVPDPGGPAPLIDQPPADSLLADPFDHGCEGLAGEAIDQCRSDRKSTRLNSSHGSISYAVFCLKKKKNKQVPISMVKKTKTKNTEM